MKIRNLGGVRDYNSYARQLEDNSSLKFVETAAFVIPGRIGDIGCATGAWLQCAAATRCFGNSLLFGVEVAAPLYAICAERKAAGEFGGARIELLRGDALAGPFFPTGSMDTVHTSSVTHEIYSLTCDIAVRRFLETHPGVSLAAAHAEVGERQLRRFIAHRYQELRPGGVWINRDVVGPERGHTLIDLEFSGHDGIASHIGKARGATRLADGSTLERFQRFVADYRRAEGGEVHYRLAITDGRWRARLPLRDAWEFATKKDYTDNWDSEMHESFCFWSFSDWVRTVEDVGFEVLAGSRTFTNPWIVERRLRDSVRLFPVSGANVEPLPFPSTNMVLVARKQRLT